MRFLPLHSSHVNTDQQKPKSSKKVVDVNHGMSSNQPFPIKLHSLLSLAEEEGLSHIISWQPGGKSFKVYHPRFFQTQVLSRWFKQKNLASFRRQLNLYNFKRIHEGIHEGAYYHPLFLKNDPFLASRIFRTPIKGKRSPTEKLAKETNRISSLNEAQMAQRKTPSTNNYSIPEPSLPPLPQLPSLPSSTVNARIKREMTQSDEIEIGQIFPRIFPPSATVATLSDSVSVRSTETILSLDTNAKMPCNLSFLMSSPHDSFYLERLFASSSQAKDCSTNARAANIPPHSSPFHASQGSPNDNFYGAAQAAAANYGLVRKSRTFSAEGDVRECFNISTTYTGDDLNDEIVTTFLHGG